MCTCDLKRTGQKKRRSGRNDPNEAKRPDIIQTGQKVKTTKNSCTFDAPGIYIYLNFIFFNLIYLYIKFKNIYYIFKKYNIKFKKI